MKKIRIVFLVLISFFLLTNVFAKEKIFSLIDYKKGVYYDERKMNENDFTKEMNLVTGKTYQESITIRNETSKEQELYLLLESVGADGSYNDIMEYSHLKVSLDGKEIYNDTAKIMDYVGNKENLYDYVPLGKLKEKSSQKLEIELVLNDEYRMNSENSFAYITCSFHQKEKDNTFTVVEKATPQMIYNFLSIWIFCGVCVFVSLLGLSIYYLKRHPLKKKDKEEKDKKEEKKKDEK